MSRGLREHGEAAAGEAAGPEAAEAGAGVGAGRRWCDEKGTSGRLAPTSHAHQLQDPLGHRLVDPQLVHRHHELLVQKRAPHHAAGPKSVIGSLSIFEVTVNSEMVSGTKRFDISRK